nr:RNA-directed DNA polymerase, eukaryota [Tanacetum cinerariifolium]
MGDFNEVRLEHERYGLVFNVQSAAAFNNFISLASLIDLPLDGYAYTWVYKSATKMSKLDPFLISKGLMASFPHLSVICLDEHLSDHHPILMREMNIDYGPTPGVLVNGDWIVKPNDVKNEFLNHFSSQFDRHVSYRICLADVFNNQLSLEQQDNLERTVSIEEIKRADSSNLKIILKVLKCFHMASGLKININKSKLMGYGVHSDEVETATRYIGCAPLVALFSHLGVKVGGRMERINSWDDVVSKVTSRLSKWKLKTLSIGCRLILIKSLLTSFPLYQMSSIKVPIKVLNILESIRRNFFNGIEGNKRKLALISWDRVLASKKYGAIHGEKGNLGAHGNITRRSPWLDIVRDINIFRSKGSYHREPRGGIEEEQQNMLFSRISGVILLNMRDRWIWSFEDSRDFSITSAQTATRYIGCATFVAPFSHLGVKVGGRMERINSWDDVMCSFKVPIKVLNILESIKRKFFNGIEGNERKLTLISWDRVLASKKYGGLGVSTIHGEKGNLGAHGKITRHSPWLDIVRDINLLHSKGSYHREPRGGIEEEQQNMLFSRISGVILLNMRDRWIWSFEDSRDFSITSARRLIDDYLFPKGDV